MIRYRLATTGAALAILGAATIFSASRAQDDIPNPGSTLGSPTLRQAAAGRGFLIGANTDKPVASYEPEYAQTLAREFNTLSTSASLWMTIHPEKDVWDFSFLDSVVTFAWANKMRVLATPIMWGARGVDAKGKETWNNYPRYYLHDKLKPAELRAIMRQHITKLVTRYKGRVQEWVVVNEPFEWSPARGGPVAWRQDVYSRKLGAVNYMADAFKIAHAADPKAILILNEGLAEGMGPRPDAVYRLVRELIRRGAPVHAVGMQMHWINFEPKPPPITDIEQNIARLAALGVKVKFTEVDVMVGHLDPAVRDDEQERIYRDIMKVCLRSPACDELVLWGFTDKHNWYVDEMGYTDEQPLIFNGTYEPKPAYFALLGALLGR